MAAAAFHLPCVSKLAAESRVKKFNIGTELRMAFGAALRATLPDQPEEFDRIKILGATIPHTRKVAKAVLQELATSTSCLIHAFTAYVQRVHQLIVHTGPFVPHP